MERSSHILAVIFCMLTWMSGISLSATDQGIRIIPQSLTVSDDSVHIDLKITATGIRIPSEESLTLVPSLHFGKKSVDLPPVVLSGNQRARFDRREELVNPDRNKPLPYHTWIGIKRGNNYTLRYRVSLPYASWMEHAALRLKQISKDCCTEQLLADDVLTKDINLPSPCATLAETADPAPTKEPEKKKIIKDIAPIEKTDTFQKVTNLYLYAENVKIHKPKEQQTAAATLYIDYPRGGSKVDPAFGRNRKELLKVDSLLSPLLSNPYIYIKEIRITGYASPDGAYYDNEALAKARSLGFRSFLTKSYGLEDYPFRTAWVAEDWEGLRRLIRGQPYEKGATFIIDNFGIFKGRERYLMQLDGGAPYKVMLRELFPKLRRIEINIIYDERYEK